MIDTKEEFYQKQILSEIKRLGSFINTTLVIIKKQLKNELPKEIYEHFEYTCREMYEYFEVVVFLLEKKNQVHYLFNESSNLVRAAFESAVKSAYIIKNKNYISYYHICLARLRGYKTIKNELEKLKELNPDDFTIKSASTLKLINDKELKHRERYVEEASKFNTSDNTSDAHLEGKCKILGGLWNLYYISVYRLLSQTIHGDVHNKKSSDFHFVGGKVKAIYQYKTISVLSNWNAIAELYMHTICKQHSAMHLLDEYFIRKELYENKVDEFIKNSQVNIRRGA